MHELFNVNNTEEILKKECIKIGERMYVRKELEIFKSIYREFDIVFMMGGAGSRLLHVTNDNFSKHMIRINNKPLSMYTFELWKNNGFNKFCFLIDNTHRGESIKNFYDDGSKFDVNIRYSVETTKLGSGGALKKAIEDGIIKDSFISHFPDDQIIDYPTFPKDFSVVTSAAFESGYLIVLICVPGALYPYGEVMDENGEVADFIEKPFIKKDSFTGICAIHKDAFPYLLKLESNKEVKMERTVFKKLAKEGKIFKVLIPTECWIPVNDDPSLRRFEEYVKVTQNQP